MAILRLEFGYCPTPLQLRTAALAIELLPRLTETVAQIESDDGVDKEWIYAPAQQVHDFGTRTIRTLPYSSRVFGLPKTHKIEHSSADGADHVVFHVWVLSFFTGMRLTTTQAGFLDATPIKPGKLVDFVLSGSALPKSIEIAETFWRAHCKSPERAQLYRAAVHALFLGQSPHYLEFEKFIFLYTAMDACFALAASMHPPAKRVNHAERIDWMCSLFGMKAPEWSNSIAGVRNPTLHEALFAGQPLGFALYGHDSNLNLTLEMQALICRLLVVLLGGGTPSYVRSPVNTRQRYRLNLT